MTRSSEPDSRHAVPDPNGSGPRDVHPATPAVSTQRNATPAPDTDNPPLPAERPREIGGPKGLEPTRYGDWERNGRCTDF